MSGCRLTVTFVGIGNIKWHGYEVELTTYP